VKLSFNSCLFIDYRLTLCTKIFSCVPLEEFLTNHQYKIIFYEPHFIKSTETAKGKVVSVHVIKACGGVVVQVHSYLVSVTRWR